MRELKFRAWDKIHKEMLYDVLEIEQGGLTITSDLPQAEMNMATGSVAPMQARDLIWQQYIGLKDKNGVEIYESDIISINKMEDNNNEGDIGQVYFERGAFRIGQPHKSGYLISDMIDYNEQRYQQTNYLGNVCEIIGNIYENKDLLK